MRKNKLKFLFFLAAIAAVMVSHAQMQFIENKGQWGNTANFRGDFNTGSFFLENQGFTVALNNVDDLYRISSEMHGDIKSTGTGKSTTPTNSNPLILHSHAYKVTFLGASTNIQRVPDKALPTYNNYFLGNDKSKWAANCQVYEAVTYKNVYPNIDVRYYSNGDKLKYDIIVYPGGNPNLIAMRYDGASKLEIKNKELVIGTSVGDVKELYPYSYQVVEKGKTEIPCKYVLRDNVVSFNLTGYSPTATLVIDPSLVFSTFTGSTEDNWGYTATPGPDGSFFAGGISFGKGFPTTTGAYQHDYSGGNAEGNSLGFDIAIMKFTALTGNRVYATYLGGSGNEQPHSMMCDAQGNLVVAGRSNSPNYPVTTTPFAGSSGGGYDIVITKFNATGTGILGSIKVGGASDDGVNIRPKSIAPEGTDATRRNYGDDARSEVILDGSGNVYLASCTQSKDFPLKNAVQTLFNQGASSTRANGMQQDGVIMKFSPNLNTALFSTYFGGEGDDACFVLALNPITGNLYVGGGATKTGLPGDKTGVIAGTYQGGDTDGFVTELLNDGSAIIRTTYIGTSGNDLVYGVQFDKEGSPYIMGTTTGTWTIKNAAFSNAGSKQFIAKLKPDLSDYTYSTVFGTGSALPNISPVAFLVDRCQNVYVSGWGGGVDIDEGYANAGTFGMPIVNQIPGLFPPDGRDFYFFVLQRDAQAQLFGSFFGQNGGFGDHVDGGTSRFDANGIIYQAICANCGHGQNVIFPTTPGVWSSTNKSSICNEAAVKIEMNFSGVGASIKATIDGVIDTVGCVPITVVFTDTLAKGKKYIWDYGDPSSPKKDTTYAPDNTTSHTYNNVGRYRVMVVSIDSSTCNVADTAYINVKVGNNVVTPKFNFVKLDSCSSLRFQFNNLTTAVVPTFTNQTFTWNFGDGSPEIQTDASPQLHTYPSTGSYKVTLTVTDTLFCNYPQTYIDTVNLSPNVKARFTAPTFGCAPFTYTFKNTSIGGRQFLWQFSDNINSTDYNATRTFTIPGRYSVRLIVTDTSTCNKTDTSAYVFFTVYDKPSASFTWSPNPPVENTRTVFTNTSSPDAVKFLWDFGDGTTSTERNPIHQYEATKTYSAYLVAYNQANCTDTFRRDIQILITPLLDVPNAFTPNRFGTNAVIKVVGFGIGKMSWKIYNRWGQVVFESTDKNSGWNGYYKGVLQPTDVYTYTLDVEFTDGQKYRKTGDISLLR